MNVLRRHSASLLQRRLGPLLLAPVLMCLPACSSQMPFGRETSHVYRPPTPAILNATLKNETRSAESAKIPSAEATSESVHISEMKIRTPGFRPGLEVSPVAWYPPQTGACPPGVQFTPAEERLDPSCCRQDMCDLYPDEYLTDGGDRSMPVHYFGGSRQGLDTEDTIAEYFDHTGKQRVRASNRVCVYAPRFGAVRVVEGAGMDIAVNQAFGATDVAAVGSVHRQRIVEQAVKDLPPGAVGARRRADGAETSLAMVQAEQATRASENRKIDQQMEGRSTKGLNIFELQQSPEFSHQLANAVIWTRQLYPMLSASTSQATQIRVRFTPQAVIGMDDQAQESEIQIVKLADRDTAEPGDFIHFTIRYHNTGDYDLHDVRIVDNLTPRLLFVPDSAQSDRSGEVITEDNGEGSQLVIFTLDKPLPARKSGRIEFVVKVR